MASISGAGSPARGGSTTTTSGAGCMPGSCSSTVSDDAADVGVGSEVDGGVVVRGGRLLDRDHVGDDLREGDREGADAAIGVDDEARVDGAGTRDDGVRSGAPPGGS